jgi:hypothetical protein
VVVARLTAVALCLAALTFPLQPRQVQAAAPAPLAAGRLEFGLSSDPSELNWMTSTGVPWKYRYTYLAGGVNTGSGWETWNTPSGAYATFYMDASYANGYVPVFPYYELLQSTPSTGSNESDRDFNNLNNTATMAAYYANFKLLMQKAGAFGHQVVIHVEPDLWGYLEQRAGTGDASNVTASVGSSGFADAAGIPNTAQGFAQALLHIRDLYATNAVLAIHASMWSSGFDVASDRDPALNAVIEADRTAAFLNSAGVSSNPYGSTWDVVFNDVDDHDAGWWEAQGANNTSFTHWWDPSNVTFPNFNRYLSWVSELHVKTGRQQVVWQVPVGNQYFLTMNNRCGHYQDNIAQYFIAHAQALFNAGLVAVMFGAGNGCQTNNTDAQNDGVTNNSGVPTTDLNGYCNACNTHTSLYSDDDGGYLRIFVGDYYKGCTAANTPSWASACSTKQYALSGNNGTTWVNVDTTNLSTTFTPSVDSWAIVSGNADLFTSTNGYNQDLGVALSGGIYPTTLGQPEAWEESGGFAGTLSPNAAYVQKAIPVLNGVAYTARLVWKANRSDPGKIFIGAGPIGGSYSPTRLTVQLIPNSAATVFTKFVTTQQPLTGSDGARWQDIDTTNLRVDFTPPTGTWTAFVSGNADLFTDTAGFNQDIGVALTGGAFPTNTGQPEAWKESGGFAGTFSPNAAFVQAPLTVSGGTAYTARLVWKANQEDPGSIYAGAGPISTKFSPTTLTVILVPLGAPAAVVAGSTQQYSLANSNGSTWVAVDTTALKVTLSPSVDSSYMLSVNADLFTSVAGYNQDVGIMVSGGTFGVGTLVAWKESGGFGGTFSPNAALVTTNLNVAGGTTYMVSAVWKANRNHLVSNAIFIGAGPIKTRYSPTWLTAIRLS